MKEEWKPIKGYLGYYEISNKGRLKSLERKRYNSRAYLKSRILKQSTSDNGYKVISLTLNGKYKTCYIHKMVAESFLPKAPAHLVVDHIDENKSNNCKTNLQYITHRENIAKSRIIKRNLPSGVSITAEGRYRVRIYFLGRDYSLGNYPDCGTANSIYKYASKFINKYEKLRPKAVHERLMEKHCLVSEAVNKDL
tara:strand:- start:498 stop:1082 length:585 start_codon:yes stop_codon:yes gene_type:complete